MCAVSNIGDMGRKMWPDYEPYKYPQFPPPYTKPDPFNPGIGNPFVKPYNGPTKEQFEEFLKLMRQAKKLDAALGLPDCEQAEKINWLKGLAKYLGCDVSDLAK